MFINADEAHTKQCCGPDSLPSHCIGPECMAWRWEPLMASPDWIAAVKKAAAEIGDKTPSRVKAAEHVNANRAAYGLPDKPYRGWCGLAGHPDQFT